MLCLKGKGNEDSSQTEGVENVTVLFFPVQALFGGSVIFISLLVRFDFGTLTAHPRG